MVLSGIRLSFWLKKGTSRGTVPVGGPFIVVIWLVLVEIQIGLDFILYSFTGRDQTHDNVLEE